MVGCAEKAPSPEWVFSELYTAMVLYSQQELSGYQKDAYQHLSQASKTSLKERADVLQGRLGEGVSVKPYELLGSLGHRHGVRILRSEVIAEDGDQVTLRVTFEQGSVDVGLIRESGHWKVLLPDLPPLQPTSAKRG